jgi:hypothetical protein
MWRDSAGRSLPIGQPAAVSADGRFQLPARAPSVLAGDAWSSLGGSDSLLLTVRKPGRAAVLAAQQGQATAALDHVEASRSRTFVDLLALTALPRPATRVAPALLTEEARWLARLRGLLAQKPGDVPDYWRQVQEAWEHLEQLWANLADTEYAAMRQGH